MCVGRNIKTNGLMAFVVLYISLLAGCTHEQVVSRFLDSSSWSVLKNERCQLVEGPYKWRKTLSPNTIRVRKDGREISVILRGCLPTGNPEMDRHAEGIVSSTMSGVFLLKSSVKVIDENTISAVVYHPGSQYYIGKDENGEMCFDTVSYGDVQLVLFVYGYSQLDHSDTDNPLYEEFAKAEAVAKKHGIGCWAPERVKGTP